MFGRWFRRSKERISVEELAQSLAKPPREGEAYIYVTPASREFETELRPLGMSLVRVSAVFWASANSRLVEQLSAERYSTFMDTYYKQVWEEIVSRFGAQRAQYDEFVRDLGGWIIPDEIKTDWALRSGVHDVLRV